MRTVLKGLTHDLAGTKIIKGDKHWQSTVDKDVASKLTEQTLPDKDPRQLDEFKDNVLNLLKHKENLTLELGKRQFMMKGHDQQIIDNKMGDIKMMESIYKELHLKEAREMRNEDNIKNATSLGQNKEKNIFYLKRKSKKVNLSEMFKDPREQITEIELRRAIKERHQKYFNRSLWINEGVSHTKSRAKGFADIVTGNLYASLVEPGVQVRDRDDDIHNKTNFRKGFILNGDENHSRYWVEGDDGVSGEGSKFDARSQMRSPMAAELGQALRRKSSVKISGDRNPGRVGSVCVKPGGVAFGMARKRISTKASYSNLEMVPENGKHQRRSIAKKGPSNLNFTIMVKPEDNQGTGFGGRLKNTQKETLQGILASEKDLHRATPGPRDSFTFSGIAPTKKSSKIGSGQVSFQEIPELMNNITPPKGVRDLSPVKPNPYHEPKAFIHNRSKSAVVLPKDFHNDHAKKICVFSQDDSSCNLEIADDHFEAVQLIEATKGVVAKFETTLKVIRNEKKYVVENLLPKICTPIQKEWFRAIKFELMDRVEEMHITDRSLISSIDVFGQSGLHWAVKRWNPKLVEFLIENGCDTTTRDDLGRTAGDLAKRYGYNKIWLMLLRAENFKIDIPNHNVKDDCGECYQAILDILAGKPMDKGLAYLAGGIGV